MSWLGDFFSGGKDPYKAAAPYLDQIPGQAHQSFDPYIAQGKTADTDLWARFSDMLNNPNKLYDKMAEGYKPSDDYQFKSKEMSQNLSNAAAAGGISGTPYHQEQQGKLTDELLSGDRNDYLQKIMGIFNTGLQGEQGVSNRGWDANKTLTDFLTQALEEKGQLAFKGTDLQNQNRSALVNNFLKYISGGAGAVAQGMGGAGGGMGGGGGAAMAAM